MKMKLKIKQLVGTIVIVGNEVTEEQKQKIEQSVQEALSNAVETFRKSNQEIQE